MIVGRCIRNVEYQLLVGVTFNLGLFLHALVPCLLGYFAARPRNSFVQGADSCEIYLRVKVILNCRGDIRGMIVVAVLVMAMMRHAEV